MMITSLYYGRVGNVLIVCVIAAVQEGKVREKDQNSETITSPMYLMLAKPSKGRILGPLSAPRSGAGRQFESTGASLGALHQVRLVYLLPSDPGGLPMETLCMRSLHQACSWASGCSTMCRPPSLLRGKWGVAGLREGPGEGQIKPQWPHGSQGLRTCLPH